MTVLHGRDAECAAIDGLLTAARRGDGGALALRGGPGMGKTALLQYAAERGCGMRILQMRGVEAEARLSFAGLHAVLRPLLPQISSLPAPQAAALSGALGLAEASGPNRFLIAAGVLGVLAEAAGRQPVLCLVDDAHWLDSSSLDAFLFAARRIESDPIAMIFATRTGEADLPGLPEVSLGPIDPAAALDLLRERAGAALQEPARRQVLTLAAGNPLALVELSAELAAAAGRRDAAAAGLPLGARLERAFLHRIGEQPDDVRRLLLLASADDSGELGTLLAAARSLGIDRSALSAAERARLLRVEPGGVEFVHPLVRSAIYQTAPFAERQDVHLALAGVLDGDANAGRRAWHRAAAAVPPAEGVADELEKVADDARARAGHGVAARTLERAAALTGDPARRARLLLDAAEDAWESGGADAASALVAKARGLSSDPIVEGRIDQLRGRIEARRGTALDGYQILIDGVDRIVSLDPLRAAGMLVDALQAASYGGDLGRVVEAGRRAERLLQDPDHPVAVPFVAGVGALLSGDAARAATLLREVVARAEETADPLVLAWAGTAAGYLGDIVTAGRYGVRAVARARASGALSTLSYALETLATTQATRSPASAEANAAEGLRLAREVDQPSSVAVHLGLLAFVAALRGDEEATLALTDEIGELASKHGLGFPQARAISALGWLDLGLGRPDQALDRLEGLIATGHPGVALISTPDLVEAGVRLGRPERVRPALAPLEAWASSSASPWPLAALARCRALLAEGEAATRHFEEALAHHAPWAPTVDSARTQLLYAEFLRRERRRLEARPHLRDALATFERVGATPWADRARSELRATGETARRRTPDTLPTLTPQELQIARFVAAGATNKEVAAQLFVSPRTVDHHLRNVFTKLGISSRRQLRERDLTG